MALYDVVERSNVLENNFSSRLESRVASLWHVVGKPWGYIIVDGFRMKLTGVEYGWYLLLFRIFLLYGSTSTSNPKKLNCAPETLRTLDTQWLQKC